MIVVDVSYLVRGYVTKEDVENNEKRIIYVGRSPKEAFSLFRELSIEGTIDFEIWEDGVPVYRNK